MIRGSKTPQNMVAAVFRDVDAGTSITAACQAAGIDRRTYYRWRARYALSLPAELPEPLPPSEKTQLYRAQAALHRVQDLIDEGASIRAACRETGVARALYYRWHDRCGDLTRRRGWRARFPIRLDDAERCCLRGVVAGLVGSADEVLRARILLACDEHPEWTANQVAEHVGCFPRVVPRCRRRWCERHTVRDLPRPGARSHRKRS